MTAKEMFKQLGYKYEYKTGCINFKMGLCDDDAWKIICFELENKIWFAFDYYNPLDIDIPTMKAIYKQCEELGWL